MRVSTAILCVAFALTTQSQTVVAGDSLGAAKLEEVAAERMVWGLSGDLGVISSILQAGTDIDSEWGIVMTADEAATLDMPSRIAFGRDVHENLLPDLQALPTYGGAWFDQARDSRLTVALTKPDAAADAAIEVVAARHHQEIAVQYVEHSFKSLDSAAHDIWTAWADLAPKADLLTVSVDEIHNGLAISVPGDQLSTVDVAGLQKSLGVPVGLSLVYRNNQDPAPIAITAFIP